MTAESAVSSGSPKSNSMAKSCLPPPPKFINQQISVVHAPFAEGQGLGGVNKAPDALVAANLAKVCSKLHWSISCEKRPFSRDFVQTQELSDCVDTYSDDEIKNSRKIGHALQLLFEDVKEEASKTNFVLTLGGDHSIAAATISGMLEQYPELCVVWIDAHGDCNTPETSPSAHYHGMPAAHVMGWFRKRVLGFEWLESARRLREDRLCYVGLRDIDPLEKQLIVDSDVAAFSMYKIDAYGIAKTLEEGLAHIDPLCNRPIHISLDIDACDPSYAMGTGTRARGGLTYREVLYILTQLRSTGRVVSMDLVEINPDLDEVSEILHGDDPDIPPSTTATVRLGIECIATALGKTLL